MQKLFKYLMCLYFFVIMPSLIFGQTPLVSTPVNEALKRQLNSEGKWVTVEMADGTSFSTAPIGGGDVVGPASSVDSEIAIYNSTTGKLLKRYGGTGMLKATGGVIGPATAGTDYVAPNAGITGATNTKITYDAKGLVTSGAAATTADIADSTDKRYVTDAQSTVIGNTSGTNTGDNAANSSTTYVGTTAISLNRASAPQALTGITSIDGNASTVTTNANLTGHVTSTGNAAVLGSFSSSNLSSALTDETGTLKSVFSDSPTITTLLNLSVGNFDLDNTTNANQFGIITKNGTRFIHDFNYGNNGTVMTLGYNTFIGVNAANLTMGSTAVSNFEGSYNTAVGDGAFGSNTTGYSNVAIGVNSTALNTTGHSNTAVGVNTLNSNITGYLNTALGNSALFSNTTGYYNTSFGYQSGYNSGVALQTNNNSVFVGRNANSSVDGLTNVIAIGSSAQATQSNQVILGNSSITQTILRGNVLLRESYTDASNYAQLKTTTDGTSYRWSIDQLGTGIANRPFVFLQTASATGTGWDFQTGTGTSKVKWDVNGKSFHGIVGNSTGTPGNATLNTVSGKSAIAAAAINMTLTNSNIATTSLLHITPLDTDVTATAWKYSVAAGVGTITVNAAATATWKFSWQVIN